MVTSSTHLLSPICYPISYPFTVAMWYTVITDWYLCTTVVTWYTVITSWYQLPSPCGSAIGTFNRRPVVHSDHQLVPTTVVMWYTVIITNAQKPLQLISIVMDMFVQRAARRPVLAIRADSEMKCSGAGPASSPSLRLIPSGVEGSTSSCPGST